MAITVPHSQVKFLLTGILSGKTIRLGEFSFTKGALVVTRGDALVIGQQLGRFWRAYPENDLVKDRDGIWQLVDQDRLEFEQTIPANRPVSDNAPDPEAVMAARKTAAAGATILEDGSSVLKPQVRRGAASTKNEAHPKGEGE